MSEEMNDEMIQYSPVTKEDFAIIETDIAIFQMDDALLAFVRPYIVGEFPTTQVEELLTKGRDIAWVKVERMEVSRGTGIALGRTPLTDDEFRKLAGNNYAPLSDLPTDRIPFFILKTTRTS
jgi:hypothetical protein